MRDDLTPDAIAALCQRATAAAVAIEVVQQTGSTNADLLGRLARLADAAPTSALTGPTLLVARRQDAGRGRAGRSWHSDDASLTFSLAWRFRQPLSVLLGLPLAVGVAVAEVLGARGYPVTLKWPNDVLMDGRKLAGILIETATTPSLLHHETWAVIGIGINLENNTEAPLPDTLPDGSVPIARLPITERNVLMAALLDSLAATMQVFAECGLQPFVERWNALHAHAGQLVDIFERQQIVRSGQALGVDASGRLLLQTGQGQVAIVAGDVSLRLSGSPSMAEVGDAVAD